MPFLNSPPKAHPQADATTVAATVAAMALITGLFVVYTRPSMTPSMAKAKAAPSIEAAQTQVPSKAMEDLGVAMTALERAI
jgi:hypothetical protein